MRTPRFVVPALVAAALVLAVVPAPAVAAGSPPVPFPSRPKGLKAPVALPAQVDPPSRYVPQNACQPGTPTGVAKLRELAMRTYGVGGRGNTARGCSEGVSEHADGRAWDWMLHVSTAREKAAAADFLAWLTKDGGTNARRLGIMYVIYNKKIWAIYRAGEGWRPSSGHTDHIHLSFSWNGARGTTSFWTGKVHPVDHGTCARFAGQPGTISSAARTTPCYAQAPLVKRVDRGTLRLGSRATAVRTAQKALGVTQSGVLDARTRTAVRAYQVAHDLPQTGAVDTPTWASLVPSTVTSDVSAGMTRDEAVAEGAGQASPRTLARWAAGRDVLVLQVALGLPRADRNGYFNAVTLAAVRRTQEALGRTPTGTWTAEDWAALAG